MDVLKITPSCFGLSLKLFWLFTYKHDLTYLKCKKYINIKTRDVVTVEWVFL